MSTYFKMEIVINTTSLNKQNIVSGLSKGISDLSQVHLILSLHRWLRLVCSVSCEQVLHEAVLSLCVDACSFTHCCDTELSHHSEHLRRTYLVRNFLKERKFTLYVDNVLI